jgi:hypothetical protein
MHPVLRVARKAPGNHAALEIKPEINVARGVEQICPLGSFREQMIIARAAGIAARLDVGVFRPCV